jgi:hypothetical protein
MLAAQAAIELDSLHRGKSIGLSTVNEIADRLLTSFDRGGENGKRAAIDSSTFAIVGQALDSAEWSGRLKTTEELITEAGEVAKAMNDVTENAKPELVEKIRNFCVALSKYSAAYRQSLHDLTPSHNFRR